MSKIDKITVADFSGSVRGDLQHKLLEENHSEFSHAVCPNLVLIDKLVAENPEPKILFATDSVVGRFEIKGYRLPVTAIVICASLC